MSKSRTELFSLDCCDLDINNVQLLITPDLLKEIFFAYVKGQVV